MIVLLTTRAHQFTHKPFRRSAEFDFREINYHQALRSRRLPRATYIFSDMDRLNFWELELAGRLYQQLAAEGVRVLNDPARARQRFSLLRTLHDRGINEFEVWRVEDTSRPDRFPVFLRCESAHRGVVSGLLHNAADVDQAINDALASGMPRGELLLIEYRAQPVREGVFRKLAIYRVADRMVPALSVHEQDWSAKTGSLGIAGEELYEEEHHQIVNNVHADAVRPAFEAAEIEYGRADFGLVDGRPQVYEINTNPWVRPIRSHPFPIRMESGRLAFEQLVQAFAAIDSPTGRPVRIDDEVLTRQRRKDRWMTGPRWVP